MGWSIGYDHNRHRDIGYGVPATCDHPGCGAEIDRGFAYVCGGEPYGGEDGCGLYFCGRHLTYGEDFASCERCAVGAAPFAPTPDLPRWIAHKLTDASWQGWRDENPADVATMRAQLAAGTPAEVDR